MTSIEVYFFGMGANMPKRHRTWKYVKTLDYPEQEEIPTIIGICRFINDKVNLSDEPLVKVCLPSKGYEAVLIRQGSGWDVYEHKVMIEG